jgi:hypothetical protein
MATSLILEDSNNKVKNIYQVGAVKSTIVFKNPSVSISSDLPFRVRFTSIKVPGYSSSNPPPIPLQLIGFSNYIL